MAEGHSEYWETLTEEEKNKLTDFKETVKPMMEKYAALEFPLDEGRLVRFLRARNFKRKKALKMIEEDLTWRENMQPQTLKREDYVHYIKSGIVRFGGKDKEGRIIIIISASKFLPGPFKEFGMEKYAQFVAFMIHETERRTTDSGKDQAVLIFDFTDWGLKNMDYGCVKVLIGTIQDHYPERLGVCKVINTPWVFRAVWKVVYPWINERTRKKIDIVGSKYQAVLTELVGEDTLESKFGGKHDEYPLELTAEELAS